MTPVSQELEPPANPGRFTTPYPAQITQMLVRPGDKVHKGQRIAIVEAPMLKRTMAELSAERARIISRLAQLEGRRQIVDSLLPIARSNLKELKSYLDRIDLLENTGFATGRTRNEVGIQHVSAAERVMTLEAERTSVQIEIQGNKTALGELSAAYENMQQTYNGGLLLSPVDGFVGSDVASVGQVLQEGTKVANIHSGESFILAYLPENYVFDVREGEKVGVKVRAEVHKSFIVRVLPVTDALPPEFQLPNRQRERGQLVRINVPSDFQHEYPIDQKVRVTSCFTKSCAYSVKDLYKTVLVAVHGFIQRAQATPSAFDTADGSPEKLIDPQPESLRN